MKQLEVSILNQVYMLGCPEGGEALLTSAVNAVDREMTVIQKAGKVKARERIAVLAALNLAYQLAERGNGSAAAPHAAAPALAPPSAHDGPISDQAALDALIRRLDNALGDDGRLL